MDGQIRGTRVPLTTKTTMFVGSYFEALHDRNLRKPTKKIVLVVQGSFGGELVVEELSGGYRGGLGRVPGHNF